MATTIDEAQLPPLLEAFYGRVQKDPMLAPVFDAAIQNWDDHLGKLAAFWSSVMLTSGRYKGNPVEKHLKHAGTITPVMFERWLQIWSEVTAEMLEPAIAATMQEKAARIGRSLQLAIDFRTPEQSAAAGIAHLSPVSAPYKSTPVFDAETLPAGLRREHRTKAGVWGVVRVLEGVVRYNLEDGSPPVMLVPGEPGLIRPEQPHHVEPVGAMRMQVDFYDHEPNLG